MLIIIGQLLILCLSHTDPDCLNMQYRPMWFDHEVAVKNGHVHQQVEIDGCLNELCGFFSSDLITVGRTVDLLQ